MMVLRVIEVGDCLVDTTLSWKVGKRHRDCNGDQSRLGDDPTDAMLGGCKGDNRWVGWMLGAGAGG